MGYDLYTKEQAPDGKGYFRANIWGMSMLRQAMQSCEVESQPETMREIEPDNETGEPQALLGDLWSCFSSNDGWLVTPEECRYIADKLQGNGPSFERYRGWDTKGGELVPTMQEVTVADQKYIQEFAAFCEKAASLGGFYVW